MIFSILGCCNPSCANSDVEKQQKEIRAKINRVQWLENVETNKLYKNQQKRESAEKNLNQSQIEKKEVERQLQQMELKLSIASNEYNSLNRILGLHLRNAYKSQRNARFQILLNSDDINMLVDRCYYQRIILKQDELRMMAARNKAQEIALMRNNIILKKRSLDRFEASIKSQQDYINRAIARNESMINKLKTDRIAYQKAEKELTVL